MRTSQWGRREEKEETLQELQDALSRVKTLMGLISYVLIARQYATANATGAMSRHISRSTRMWIIIYYFV
jgi:hypothetical protein